MIADLSPVPLIALSHDRVALAYANWGAWVADCPNLDCTSALQLEPGQGVFRCGECPTVADIAWPQEAATITALLMLRPNPATRNWLPHESATDLMFQNVAHGIDASVNHLDGSTRGQLIFDPDTLGVTLLPEPIAIDQAARPEIGH